MLAGFISYRHFLLTAFSLLALTGATQHFDTEYGQNRIQYEAFGWNYISTNSFDVYYSVGGKNYAKEAVDYLEEAFPELTDKIGYAPFTKPKVIIYNSIHDLQQSNIGIGGDVYTIGGKTNFVKMQAEVAYSGQAHKFQEDLIYGISKVLITDMMYGGSLGEIFQNSFLLTLPDWFIDGAARYLAFGWDEEMDDYIRDYLGRKRIRKQLRVNDAESGPIGQSLWNYISTVHGESNISNILNLTRIIRKEENSIAQSLGVGYKNFLGNWQNFYVLQKEEVILEYDSPSEEDVISKKKNKELVTTTIRVSPLGDKVAYARIKHGQYYIYVKDLETNQDKLVTKGGYRINNQEVDAYMPLLDWRDANTLGAIVFRRGNLYLDSYNLEDGTKQQKPLDRFRQIESFSFNDNGRLAVISGDVDGQNDLYLVSMRRNALRRITKDTYDDLDPMFIPGSAAIVFSSNRVNDSIKVKNIPLNDATANFNLFIYNLDTTTNSFYRLTNTYSTDRKPIPKNDYFIYYLSDQKGITNLYRFNLLDTTFSQVSSFDKGIKDYDLHFDQNSISFMMLDKGLKKVFHSKSVDLGGSNFTMPTPRQRRKQSQYLFTRRNSVETDFELDLEEDTTVVFNPLEPDEFEFQEETVPNRPKPPSDYIDTDNYVFSDEVEGAYEPDSFFANHDQLQQDIGRIGPFRYDPRFSFGNVTTTFGNDPLRGFGYILQTEVVDMMENHRFTAGGFFTQGFSQSDIFGEYQFLPYWADFQFRVDRKTYKFEDFNSPIDQTYRLTNVEVGISVPITHSFRATSAPFFARTQFFNMDFSSILDPENIGQAQDNFITYGGLRLALVYDNTVEKGFNIFQGSRGLIEYKRYQPLTSNGEYFNHLEIDLRHYQKIHREITLAGRAFYGRFWGDNQPQFLLGGVDNWILKRFQKHGEDDPVQPIGIDGNPVNATNTNILFHRFATSVRGHDFVEQFGSDAIVLSGEFRVPIFRYFIRRPISSNFLRNMQFVYFYDLGTAWSGPPPFVKKNAFTEKEFDDYPPFVGRFKDFRNPWIAGYGAGIRMSLLGYFVKIDRARPIRDFQVGNPRWHFSIGVDF